MFKEKKPETIICAAIWYKDLNTMRALPTNCDEGIVLCGWRHGNIIAQMKATMGLRTVMNGQDSVGQYVQGFLTSKNRFLNREEAHKLFKELGNTPEYEDELYSEDLY